MRWARLGWVEVVLVGLGAELGWGRVRCSGVRWGAVGRGGVQWGAVGWR